MLEKHREPDRRGGRPGSRILLLAAGLLSVAHFASFSILRPIVTDVRYYLYFAARIADGAVPHLDFFGNKTQLAGFTGALFHRLGTAFGVEPLAAIRIGYLGLAAAAGVLLFAIHRRLAGGRNVPGFLALLAYSGFAMLGVLPSIGNVPKLLAALLASSAALLACDRRWLLAGVAGWLAFMDWQVGLLALLGVFGAALCDPGQRLKSLGRSALGGFSGAVPFLLYYLAHGALFTAWQQVIGASFARGVGTMAGTGWAAKLQHLVEVIHNGCRGHEWLVALGVVGMLIYPLWLCRNRRRPSTLRLAVVLAVYHYGLVAFSLIDFQGYGDLFILLHSAAFFAAVALVEIYRTTSVALNRFWTPSGALDGRWRNSILAALALLLVCAATRPSVLRPPFTFDPIRMAIAPEATLADQWSVNSRLLPLIDGKRIAFLESAEQLFLANRENGLPFVYWNAATHAFYRSSPEERQEDTLLRLLRSLRPEVIVPGRNTFILPRLAGEFREVTLTSENGAYSIAVFVDGPTEADSP